MVVATIIGGMKMLQHRRGGDCGSGIMVCPRYFQRRIIFRQPGTTELASSPRSCDFQTRPLCGGQNSTEIGFVLEKLPFYRRDLGTHGEEYEDGCFPGYCAV
jgi:hypothetical protein